MEMRNYSDSPLAPNFDPRSVSTRYTKFGVADKRPESNTTRLNYPVYNQNANFNPETLAHLFLATLLMSKQKVH